MYIMFPIGWMYYFGTNLDQKFSVPDFWPKKEETHTVPYEKEEIEAELERLKARRLAARAKRLQAQGIEEPVEQKPEQVTPSPLLKSLENTNLEKPANNEGEKNTGKGWFSWIR